MAIQITNTPKKELNRKTLEELQYRYEHSHLAVVIRDGRIQWKQKEEL